MVSDVNVYLLYGFLLQLHGSDSVVHVSAKPLPLLLVQTYVPLVKQLVVRLVLRRHHILQ